jgi:hypothetical protein
MVPAIGRCARLGENPRRRNQDAIAAWERQAKGKVLKPGRRTTARNFITLLIKHMSANVLHGFQIFQIFPNLTLTSLFVGGDGVGQRCGAQGLPRGVSLRAKDQDSHNGQRDEQSDGQPKREKYFEKQAPHDALTFSRGRAKM